MKAFQGRVRLSSASSTPGSLELASTLFEGTNASKGLVLIAHGAFEHHGRYSHVAERVTSWGYRVVGFDFRGHGHSSGKRMGLPLQEAYLEDMQAVLAHYQAPNEPIWWIGHSMGGLQVIRWLQVFPGVAKGAVVSSPFLAERRPQASWKVSLARLVAAIAPGLRVPNGINEKEVSANEHIRESYRNDPLIPRFTTLGWYLAILAQQQAARDAAGHIREPLLVLQAGDERIVNNGVMDAWAQTAQHTGCPLELIRFPGLYHELFNAEVNKPVFEAVKNWLEAHR